MSTFSKPDYSSLEKNNVFGLKLVSLDWMWRPYWVAVPNITIKYQFMLLSQRFYWQLEDWMSRLTEVMSCDLIKFQIYMWSLKLLIKKISQLYDLGLRSNCQTSFCSTILLWLLNFNSRTKRRSVRTGLFFVSAVLLSTFILQFSSLTFFPGSPFGSCLPGTELLQYKFRMEFSKVSLLRWYRRSLQHYC